MVRSSGIWPPYFGNQKRFAPYVMELLHGIGMTPGNSLYETNAGSHAIAYEARLNQYQTHTNDIGVYSQAIGYCLYGDLSEYMMSKAFLGAALLEQYGYDLKGAVPTGVSPMRLSHWRRIFMSFRQQSAQPWSITQGNLWDFIKHQEGDALYVDFAWPWRDGRSTEEYTSSADTLTKLLTGEDVELTMPSGRQILQEVIQLLDIARKRFTWTILSNQSACFPTPEVLEPYLLACGHQWQIARRLSVPAEDVDNRGLTTEFTEYQYVFPKL